MSHLLEFGALAIVLIWPLRRALLASRRLRDIPRMAILLWQGVALALALTVVGTYVQVIKMVAAPVALHRSVSDFTSTTTSALTRQALSPGQLYVTTVGALVVVLLGGGLVVHAVGVGRLRKRQRLLIGLVTTRSDTDQRVVVVDSREPIAYGVPGPHPKVVISTAATALLSGMEQRAVINHELAHLRGRHDVALLPFRYSTVILPRSKVAASVHEHVSALFEMAADDAAIRSTGARVLASAICRMSVNRTSRSESPTTRGGEVAEAARSAVRIERALAPRRHVAVALTSAVLTTTAVVGMPILALYSTLAGR